MRYGLAVSLGCLLATVGFCDDSASARKIMSSAMLELGQQTKLTFTISGYETAGDDNKVTFSHVTSFKVDSSGGQPSLLLESRSYKVADMYQRLVGDGIELWNYNVSANAYSAKEYGNVDAAPPTNYCSQLMKLFLLKSQGPNRFAAQVFYDAFVSGASASTYLTEHWVPWLPTATVKVETDSTSTITTVTCAATTPSASTLVYTLAVGGTDDEPTYQLTSATFDRDMIMGGKAHHVHWDATIKRDSVDDNASFKFAPPANARVTTSGG